ncbi:MAG: hypothetical protein KAJ57_07885, partial [Woeseiaceae bacterium]|nr:hypothetical protein [Woeseiaceae bacterium]
TPEADARVASAPDARGPKWQDPDWSQLVGELRLTGSVRMLADNCALQKRSGNTVYFSLDPRSESLLTRPRKEALADALSSHFGEHLLVDVSVTGTSAETPNQEETRVADERVDAARASLESDPNVQTLKNLFGAELKTDSIELINPPLSD